MRYAVAFTTYSWDDFVGRQFERLKPRVKSGDIWVVADESRGSLGPIPAQHVIRTTQADILGRDAEGPFAELFPVGRKPLLWWNLDYLTYRFFSENREYDYCLTMDYDACLNVDVDNFVGSIADAKLDFVAHNHVKSTEDWMWTQPHRLTYPCSPIEGRLLCVTVISRAASDYLMQRRREMARAYKEGSVPFWPFCEVFMPLELKLGGFRSAELSEFGSTQDYGWRPAIREEALDERPRPGFVHPVLDRERFLRSTMSEQYPFSDILWSKSRMRQELEPYSVTQYLPYAASEVRKRFARRVKRLLGKS